MLTHNQKGAVTPLVAIMLVLIVVCVALVVDLGHIHNVKVELQRAVDAAALAGAQQLTDSIGAGQKAIDVAVAAAAANTVDRDPVSIDPGATANPNFKGVAIKMVQPIKWDKNITDPVSHSPLTTAARITPLSSAQYDTANGLWVTASMDVSHIFFFFTDTTPVTADAIAVNIFEEQTIPVALVSCIPTGGKSVNIASPGLSICDITTYKFHSDTEDAAAWTSLTFGPANEPNIEEFLDADGTTLFNQVIYGTEGSAPSQYGIENTAVRTDNRPLPDVPDFPVYSDVTRGCVGNDGVNISCGLGADLSLDPNDPVLIRQADPSKVPGPALTDPLAYDPLPRWYHFDDDETTFDDVYNDAFTRLLTQNGTLVQDGSESETAYQTYMEGLYNGTIPSPFGGPDDFRFKATGTKEKFIHYDNSEHKYKPDFNEVLRYAGYPPVWVNNGTIPPALTELLDGLVNPANSVEFRTEVSNDFEPFNAGNAGTSGGSGESVRLTMPVIFAGSCDDWKALSVSENNRLYYVGTANFLLTRAWKNPDCFDEGTRAITIDPVFSCPNPPPATKIFDPTISGNDIRCGSGTTPNAAVEGLMRVPTKGNTTEAGIRKIFLVE